MWLLSRLMRILNDYFCLTLHDQVIQIIVALLQAVKYKDPPSFTELLNELCELAAGETITNNNSRLVMRTYPPCWVFKTLENQKINETKQAQLN